MKIIKNKHSIMKTHNISSKKHFYLNIFQQNLNFSHVPQNLKETSMEFEKMEKMKNHNTPWRRGDCRRPTPPRKPPSRSDVTRSGLMNRSAGPVRLGRELIFFSFLFNATPFVVVLIRGHLHLFLSPLIFLLLKILIQ